MIICMPYLKKIKIRERGGKCIPVQCDHENDQDIFNLFEKIKNEQNGRLDVLVNNAYKGVTVLNKLTNILQVNKYYLYKN